MNGVWYPAVNWLIGQSVVLAFLGIVYLTMRISKEWRSR